MPDKQDFLVVCAPKDDTLTASFVDSVTSKLSEHGAKSTVVTVPSLADVALTVRYAVRSMDFHTTGLRYAGFIVVCNSVVDYSHGNIGEMTGPVLNSLEETARQHCLALGRAIVFSPDVKTAELVAKNRGEELGEKAVNDCLHMLAVKKKFGL